MGQKQSVPKQPKGEEEEALTINHPRFSNLKVLSVPSEEDEGTIEIGVPLPSQNQYKKWHKLVGQVSESENIFLPIKHNFTKTQFCGSGGVANIAYKYYPYLLSDEVVNRCNIEQKFFDEPELWYLVYSIIMAAEAFHSANFKIGDVRPHNVFISPEGQVRVATQFTWPNEQTNYLKTVFDKETTYLSPEQLKDISFGKLEEPANFALNQSFSIGLTCLDAATLTDSSKLYEANNKFNYTKLEEKLSALEKSGQYTPPLVLLIKGLCQVEGEKRITCRELAEWLDKYQQPIIELQDFKISELPDKLHKLGDDRAKDTRPAPQAYPQYPPSTYPPPSIPNGYVSAPMPPMPRQLKYSEPAVITSTYTSQPYQQMQGYPPYLYDQYTSSIHNPSAPPGKVYSDYAQNISQTSNPSPSIITFQKDVNQRSVIADNSVGSQLRGANINLQQIDEQLQMSRKLFPS